MEGDTAGVRVIPRTVEFSDVEPDKVHKISITVKNISRSSKAIRYYAPQSKVRYISEISLNRQADESNFLLVEGISTHLKLGGGGGG